MFMFPTKLSQLLKRREFSPSLIAQLFLLIVAVVLLTNLIWSITFRFANEVPRSNEIAQFAVSTVNVVRSALLAADAKRRRMLLRELSRKEGIGLNTANPEDQVLVFPFDSFHENVRLILRKKLSADTQIASEINGIKGFWVSFDLNDAGEHDYWLMLPAERASINYAWHWTVMAISASLLALIAATLIARNIAKPLADIADYVGSIGKNGKAQANLHVAGNQEMQTLAMAINRMNDDLVQNDKDRVEMLAGISHDLRTPLTRLRLETEMSVADPDIAKAMIDDIVQIDSIIGQFLQFARSEEEEKIAALSPIELIECLINPRIHRGEDISFIYDNIKNDLLIKLRPQAISRAINNLLDNAIKYGGGIISITLSIEQQNLIIAIADQGTGIPADQCDRLRRPFTRMEVARSNVTGTGLGLAIVDRIIAIHQGSMQLLSSQSGGLLVRLSLPLSS